MSIRQPIAIFDSGVGGLSVAKKIREVLPHEDILYIADSGHAPYGNKTQQFIVQRSHALVDHMLQQHAKAIVVACNTATLSAIQHLRSSFTAPIIGVEPGIKPASLLTRTGVIGVMVTARTAQSQAFHELARRYSDHARIEIQACDGLVEQIEKGELLSEKTRTLVTQYVEPLVEKGVDIIALGCTHYPLLMPAITHVAGSGVQIIETGTAVAKQVVRRLTDENCLVNGDHSGRDIFYTTGDVMKAEALISSIWGQTVKVMACSI